MRDELLQTQAAATLKRLQTQHPDLEGDLAKAHAYAIFPSVGRAAAVLGVSFGRGVVYEQGQTIGTATITKITLGVQVGGQTFSEVLMFPNKDALDKFKSGEVAFDANASAVMVKAAASGTKDFHDVVAHAYGTGGMLLEASIGGQKLRFEPLDGAPSEGEGRRKQKSSAEAEGGHGESQESGSEAHPGARGEAGEQDAEQWEEEDEEESAEDESRRGRARRIARKVAGVVPRRGAKEKADSLVESVTDAADSVRSGAEKARESGHEVQGKLRPGLRNVAGRVAHAVAKPVKGAVGRVGGGLLPTQRPIARRVGKVKDKVASAKDALANEQTINQVLHPEVNAVIQRLVEKNPQLKKELDEAYGYAVFPSVGKAGAVLGVTYGRGEVFKKGKLRGYAALVQITLGVQVGGDTFVELITFDDKDAFKDFRSGSVHFAANASAVIVKAGAFATRRYSSGTKVYVATDGGLLLEASIGGQKAVYRPAALTRGKTADVELAEAA